MGVRIDVGLSIYRRRRRRRKERKKERTNEREAERERERERVREERRGRGREKGRRKGETGAIDRASRASRVLLVLSDAISAEKRLLFRGESVECWRRVCPTLLMITSP